MKQDLADGVGTHPAGSPGHLFYCSKSNQEPMPQEVLKQPFQRLVAWDTSVLCAQLRPWEPVQRDVAVGQPLVQHCRDVSVEMLGSLLQSGASGAAELVPMGVPHTSPFPYSQVYLCQPSLVHLCERGGLRWKWPWLSLSSTRSCLGSPASALFPSFKTKDGCLAAQPGSPPEPRGELHSL